jgi:hypothetical protein
VTGRREIWHTNQNAYRNVHTTPMATPRDPYTFFNASSLPPAVTSTMAHLLRSWDDPHSNYDFISDFLPSATLRFGVDAKGHDAIRGMKDFMIHPVKGPIVDLQHTFEKGFVMPGAEEGKVDFIGTAEVWYQLRDGRRVVARPASHAVFVQGEDGVLKVEYYEVHMDSRELMQAIGEMEEGEGKGEAAK